MASNVRMPNGVDTDLVWASRQTDPTTSVDFRASDGQDFSQRYEKANGTSPSITANIRGPDGVDFSLRFATAAALPKNWDSASATAFGATGTVTASIDFTSNGRVASSGGGSSDTWLTAITNVGFQYQIMHTVSSGSSSGVPSGWLNLDSGQTISISRNTNGSSTVSGSSQIRRKSDGVIVCSGPWLMTAERGTS